MFALAIAAAAIASPPPSTALVVSGGVSLGAYQAGFLHVLTEAARRSGRRMPLVTGASAGSANAFLSGIAMCRTGDVDPRESLGWRAWIPVGFDALHQDGRASQSDGLFSRAALIASTELIWSELERGLPDTCDFVIGLTTTRLHAHRVQLEGLRIPRQEEKFIVRVQGRGPGLPPRLSNYVDPYSDVEQPLLPFESTDDAEAARRDFERLRAVLFASMAFPVAFSPSWVAYCLTEPPPGTRYLPYRDLNCDQPTHADQFLDGGVLDNNPLRLAHQVAEKGLRSNGLGEPVWRDLTESGWQDRRPQYDELAYFYLDPGLTVFPMAETVNERATSEDVFDLMRTLFMNFVSAARSKELYTLTEDGSRLTRRMAISYRYLPSAGDPLYAFMGFFERAFREFDFYLGAYDAYRYLGGDLAEFGADPEEEGWRPLACLIGWVDEGRAELRRHCEGLDNHRALLQVSLDRLWDQCRRFAPDELETLVPHPLCARASAGEPRPWVLDGAGAPLVDRRAPGEWHFKFAMRRLDAYGFEFRDLGLRPEESGRASAVVRRKLLDAMDDLATAQRGEINKTLIQSGGRVIANQLSYETPPFQGGVVIGSDLEALLLFGLVDRWRSWFRVQGALTVDGWTSPLAPGPNYLALGLLAGPEVMVPPLTGSFFQTSFGLRMGYQFGSEDRGGFEPCAPRPEQQDPRLCSQVIVQPYFALGILDRFRLQLGVDVFPAGPSGPGFDEGTLGLDFGFGLLFF